LEKHIPMNFSAVTRLNAERGTLNAKRYLKIQSSRVYSNCPTFGLSVKR
jgi:hypothetical protein